MRSIFIKMRLRGQQNAGQREKTDVRRAEHVCFRFCQPAFDSPEYAERIT